MQLNKETIARLDNMNEIRGRDLLTVGCLTETNVECLVSNACNTALGPTCTGSCKECVSIVICI